MRYRPFGATGKAVSAVSLFLREGPGLTTADACRALAFSAMENGINSFELGGASDILAIGMGEALATVERRLIFLASRLRANPLGPVTAQDVADWVRATLQKTRAGYLDLLMIDEGALAALTPQARTYLLDLKSSGVCLQVGATGDGPMIDAGIGDELLDVLTAPFSLRSDWKVRRRIREAAAASMTLIGCEPFPSQPARRETGRNPRQSLLSLRRQKGDGQADTYEFLNETPGWTYEELCLGYALTEPAFATIQLELRRPDAIERMASVTDRDLPPGVVAQIEMARFGQQPQGGM